MYRRVMVSIIILVVMVALGGNDCRNYSKVLYKMPNYVRKSNNYKKQLYSLSAVNIKSKYAFIDFNNPILIAHRGADSVAPENSIPAIDSAAKMGYWGVELDICSSSNGVLYLLHDGTLDRTTNGHGLITRQSSYKIDKILINKGSNISDYPNLKLPRFKDALIECEKDNVVPVFDIKYLSEKDRDLNTFLGIINKYGDKKRILVHAFNYKYLEYLRSKDKQIILMPMVNPQSIMHGYNYIKSFGATGIDSNIVYLNKGIIQKAHRDGLKVFCWTVDTPPQLREALNLGVDFIYSDKFSPNDIKSLKKAANPIKSIMVHKTNNMIHKTNSNEHKL